MYLLMNYSQIKNIYIIKLTYGDKNYDLKTLGDFNKFNPVFLHPEIHIFKNINNNFIFQDRFILEENLTASFLDKEIYLNKIYKIIKYCNLLI